MYRSFDEKVLAVYELLCSDRKPRSKYRIAKDIGYTGTKSVLEPINWLERAGYVDITTKQRPNGSVTHVVSVREDRCQDAPVS